MYEWGRGVRSERVVRRPAVSPRCAPLTLRGLRVVERWKVFQRPDARCARGLLSLGAGGKVGPVIDREPGREPGALDRRAVAMREFWRVYGVIESPGFARMPEEKRYRMYARESRLAEMAGM